MIPIRELRSAYKESFPLFVSTLSTQIYVNVNKLVIGSFLGMSEVSIYDLGEKVLNLMKLPISMVSQAVFPKISREKNIHFVNKIMFLLAGAVFIGYMFVFIASRQIVYLFTGAYVNDAIVVIRILGVSAIIISFNCFLGGNRLVPFGFSSMYMKIMICNCLFFLLILLILLLANMINVYTVSLMVVIVEVFCFIVLLIKNRYIGLI